MTEHSSRWMAFDAATPPLLEAVGTEAGRVVVVLTCPGAVAAGWAREVAVDLARAWAARDERIVLVDAGLGSPSLHGAFGVDNTLGLSEALAEGGSLQRAARPVDDGSFFLVTAGTPPSDPVLAVGSGRWERLCAAFRGAGVTLVAYCPVDAPWQPAILASADGCVLICTETEGEPEAAELGRWLLARLGHPSLAPAEPEALAEVDPLAPFESDLVDPLSLLGATSGPSAERVAEPQSAAPTPVEADQIEPQGRDELGATDWNFLEAPSLFDPIGLPPDMEPLSDLEIPAVGPRLARPLLPTEESDPEASAERSAPRTGARATRAATLVLAAVGTAIVLAAAWRFSVPDPTASPDGEMSLPAETPGRAAEATVLDAPTASVDGAAPPPALPHEEVPLAWSVAVGSFRDPDSAERRRAALAGEVPGVWVASVPVNVGDRLFHRVLAGLEPDSLAAERFRGDLLSRASMGTPDWMVRDAGMAFLLAESDDDAVCQRAVEALAVPGLTGYVFQVTDTEGVACRAYAGAFADETEASTASRMLSSSHVEAELTERIGRPLP